jgi:type IV pilus assembly protein PilN
MTTLLAPPTDDRLWSSMPGWGIVADLTPPELIARRHLRVLRKLIVVGLTLVVVACAGGFALAYQKNASADSDHNAVTAGNEQLSRQLDSPAFRHVVQIQGTVTKVQGQVAALMKNDVDLPTLLATLNADLPDTMAISGLTVTLTSATTAVTAGGTGLDTSGKTVIGTVTVTGSGRTLDDLPEYIDRLAKVTGVANLVPTSNLADKGSAKFNLTFELTSKLYSHRYDASTAGNK